MVKMQVIGNLGKDSIVNNVNGRSVINFSVAHTEKIKDQQGNMKDKTLWVECAYWTDRTAVAPYLKKGTQVYVEGIPDIRTYTTNDGRSGASLVLRVQSVQLLGGGNRTNEGGDAYNNAGGYNNGMNSAPNGGGYSSNAMQNGGNMSAGNASGFGTDAPVDDLPF